MKKLFLIFSSILAISCSSNKKYFLNYSSIFICEDTLAGEVLQKAINVNNAFMNISYSESGIILVNRTGKGFIKLFDTLNGECISEAGKIGNGPGEYLSPVGFCYNKISKKYYFTDNYKNLVGVAQIKNNEIELVNKINLNYKVSCFCSLSDSLHATLSVFDGHYLSLINNKGVSYHKEPHRLFDIESLDYTSHKYSSIIKNIEPSKILIVSDINFPIVRAYSYIDNKLTLKWSKEFYKSYYTIKNQRLSIDRNRHILSFHSITTSNKYIYLLTYGITVNGLINRDNVKNGKTIMLTLDLNGNILKTTLLDKCIHNATVSPDDRILYGITSDPDIYLVKFKLNQPPLTR